MNGLAMIPCAGFGLRMGPLTADRPKPLLPVHGVPLLAYSLFLLHEWQIERCIINLHYRGDQIKEYLKDFPFFPIHFSEEKERILGTAGGIRYAMQTTPLQGQFLYMNPDTIFWPDRRPEAPAGSRDLFLYLCPKEPGNTEHGFEPVVDSLADSLANHLSERFVPLRMGAGSFYYSGLSLLHTDAVSDIEPGAMAELRDTFQRYATMPGDRLQGSLYSGLRYDCGNLEQFEALKRVDPVPAVWKDRWYSFLNRWPGACPS